MSASLSMTTFPTSTNVVMGPRQGPARERAAMGGDNAVRFQRLLDEASKATGGAEKAVTPEMRATARQSAETLVAQALIAPLLAQIRDTNHAAEPFGPTEAEKRLGPVFDEHIAVGLVRRSHFDLVDNVQSTILRRAQPAGAAASTRITP